MKMTLIEKLARMKDAIKDAYLIPGKIKKAELGYLSKINTLEMKLAENSADCERVKFSVAQGELSAIDRQLELKELGTEIKTQIAALKELQAEMWGEVDMEGVEK
jgi:hypothetical protein